jgi:hypothetical protein
MFAQHQDTSRAAARAFTSNRSRAVARALLSNHSRVVARALLSNHSRAVCVPVTAFAAGTGQA